MPPANRPKRPGFSERVVIQMKIEHFSMGPIAANCYVLLDEASGEAAVIDPGACEQPLIDYLQSDAVKKVRYILLTHGHYDHLMGVADVKAVTDAPVYIHPGDAACLTDESESLADTHLPGQQNVVTPDEFLEEGMELPLGELTIRVLHTPGHSRGGVCFVVGDVIFSGDTLFRHTCGRTDLPGGDYATLMHSLERLTELSGDYQVYPGHNRATTLAHERTHNRYLRKKNLDQSLFDF